MTCKVLNGWRLGDLSVRLTRHCAHRRRARLEAFLTEQLASVIELVLFMTPSQRLR